MTIADIIIIAVYIVAMFGVGVYARTRIKSVDDFLVAGNRFKTFSLVGTLVAALTGAGTTMGIVGSVYQYGAGIMWNFIGLAAGCIIFGLLYCTAVRRTGARSMAELIAGRFGRLPRFFSGLIVPIYCLGSVTICVAGMGRLITYISRDFNLNISMFAAVLVTCIIVVGYTALGGLYSVVWTDVVQFVIMIVVIMVIGPILAIKNAGSFEALESAVQVSGTSLTNPFEGVPLAYMASSAILMFVGTPGDPTVPQRALAADTERTAKKSFVIAGILYVVFGAGLLFIGAGAMQAMPNIADTYGTTEAAFPVYIMHYYPPVLRGLGIAALLAAIMSTISAMLLVATTHLVYDVGKAIKPDLSDDTLKKVLPIAICVLGAIVVYTALKVTTLADVLYFIFSLCGSSFIFPMIATLWWKKASTWGVTAGIVLGAACCLTMYATGHMGPGGDPVYVSMAVSLVAVGLLSLIIPDKKKAEA